MAFHGCHCRVELSVKIFGFMHEVRVPFIPDFDDHGCKLGNCPKGLGRDIVQAKTQAEKLIMNMTMLGQKLT